MTQVRDFPWSPIVEAIQSLYGCLAIVGATSLFGGVVGHWLAHMCLPAGIWPRGLLGQVPLLWIFTPEVFLGVCVSFFTWHQAVFFPSSRAYVAIVALPFVVWSVAACSSVVRLGAWPTVPPEFVGEWVREDTTFNGDGLAEGRAIYLGDDGFVAMCSAPPVVIRTGKASFDPIASHVTLALSQSGDRPEVITLTLLVDWKKRRVSLKASDDSECSYKQSYRQHPRWVPPEER